MHCKNPALGLFWTNIRKAHKQNTNIKVYLYLLAVTASRCFVDCFCQEVKFPLYLTCSPQCIIEELVLRNAYI